MSNEITLNTSAFQVTRVSKSGKETHRGLLGILTSGNAAERQLAASALSLACWEKAMFRPILAELCRTFGGKAFEMSLGIIEMNPQNPTKKPMLQLVKGVASFFSDAKGEKARLVEVCKQIVAFEAKLEAERAAREAERAAKKAAEEADAQRTVEAEQAQA